MVVGNQQCNAANLDQSKPQFQLELSLAQFSPTLFLVTLMMSITLLNQPCGATGKYFLIETKNKVEAAAGARHDKPGKNHFGDYGMSIAKNCKERNFQNPTLT